MPERFHGTDDDFVGSDGVSSGAEALLKRLAEKLVEPMNDDIDGNKTIGEWRKEVAALHSEVINFEMRRRREG